MMQIISRLSPSMFKFLKSSLVDLNAQCGTAQQQGNKTQHETSLGLVLGQHVVGSGV